MADPIVLVDGDPIVYRSAFAAQHSTYDYTIEDETGQPYSKVVMKKRDLTAYMKLHPGHEVVDVVTTVELEPIENVLSTVKHTLGMIEEACGSKRLYIYLTASSGVSWRHVIAKQAGYKANRTTPRPKYYEVVRGYLEGKHGAKVVTDKEADDQLSIVAHGLRRVGDDYVVSTIDKDLDQIPGVHYNYGRRVTYTVTEEEAERWFWIQALAGDMTDNIPGCFKMSPARAEVFIDECLDEGMDALDIWHSIVGRYEASQIRLDCPYRDVPAEDVALETAQLVYLQQNEGELWMPPHMQMGRVGIEPVEV